MARWIESSLVLAQASMNERVEGYLLGRGIHEDAIGPLELGVWRPPSDPAPHKAFVYRYGPHGEELAGHLVYPLRTGKGDILGFEARSMGAKGVSQFKLDRAFWNPVFIGLHRAMPKISAGADIWIGEGLFDIAPLDYVIPPEHATLGALTAKLNHHHVEFLRRFCTGTVNMCFDRDAKGQKATHGWTDDTGKWRWGALQSLDRVGVRARDVPYRVPVGGKDPGDIWERYGAAGLREAFRAILL